MEPDALAELLAAPAHAAPAGVTPNFENPPNKNGLAWFVTTICAVVVTSSVCLRLFARVWMYRRIRIEEVMMIFAFAAYCGTAYVSYSLIFSPGYFVHTWNLHNTDIVETLSLILIYGCCYSVALPLMKTAILIDWGRIFVTIDKTHNIFWIGSWIIIILQCLWGVICILLLSMECRPHDPIWRSHLPSKCDTLPDIMLTSSTIQVVSDVAMLILPQRMVWKLQMNRAKKTGVSIIFGVGVLACISAICRLVRTIDFARDSDSMYIIGSLLFWATAEMTCGFLIFSVPCLSKIIMDSGLRRRITRQKGPSESPRDLPNPTPKSTPPDGSHQISRRSLSRTWLATETRYSKIDEDGIPLNDTGKSESQTDLNVHAHGDKLHIQVDVRNLDEPHIRSGAEGVNNVSIDRM